LDKSNEKAFQVPFCHALASQGYTVLHLSRHCGMELGKDVIAIDRSGKPCAFQLKSIKGGKLSLARWREDLGKQVYDLALGKVVHPSLQTNKAHRSFLVINGELEEEVSRAIDDFNRQHPRNRLHTILKGQLLKMFLELKSDFWPSSGPATKVILELLLMSGRERFPKQKLAHLLESVLPISSRKRPTQETCSRAIASAAVLCALVISPFSEQDNHVAEIEAWTVFGSYVLALAERWRLPNIAWRTEFQIALSAVRNALARLTEEIEKRPHLVEGDGLTDHLVYHIRLTHLIGLMSLHGLWTTGEGCALGASDSTFSQGFCEKHRQKMKLWGEAAIPGFVALYFFTRSYDATFKSDGVILTLLNTLISCNKPGNPKAIPSPYYDVDDILPTLAGIAEKPVEDSFCGQSHSLEALVHLVVRENWKQRLKVVWPDISRIAVAWFEPEKPWQYYLWRCERGTDWTRQWQRTQSWAELQEAAWDGDGRGLPRLIRQYPLFYLCFLMVFPHRLCSAGVRWLAARL